jgi:hypothetical protein
VPVIIGLPPALGMPSVNGMATAGCSPAPAFGAGVAVFGSVGVEGMPPTCAGATVWLGPNASDPVPPGDSLPGPLEAEPPEEEQPSKGKRTTELMMDRRCIWVTPHPGTCAGARGFWGRGDRHPHGTVALHAKQRTPDGIRSRSDLETVPFTHSAAADRAQNFPLFCSIRIVMPRVSLGSGVRPRPCPPARSLPGSGGPARSVRARSCDRRAGERRRSRHLA